MSICTSLKGPLPVRAKFLKPFHSDQARNYTKKTPNHINICEVQFSSFTLKSNCRKAS